MLVDFKNERKYHQDGKIVKVWYHNSNRECTKTAKKYNNTVRNRPKDRGNNIDPAEKSGLACHAGKAGSTYNFEF